MNFIDKMRKNSVENSEKKFQKELNFRIKHAYEKIDEASRKGEFIIYMHENFFIDECGDELKKKLMEEGFNVSKSLSQVVRNSPYNWSISW